MSRGAPARRRLRAPPRAILVLVMILAAATALRRSRPPAPPGPTPEERTDLHRWDLTGCWDLRVEPWEPDALDGLGPDSLPAFLTPPSRVMLLPDSTDEWGRSVTTYRAVPLAGTGTERLEGRMRWFVRADTLWLVWSDRTSAAAVALRADDAGFAGSARAVSEPDSVDITARARARKLNCATLLPETERAGPAR